MPPPMRESNTGRDQTKGSHYSVVGKLSEGKYGPALWHTGELRL